MNETMRRDAPIVATDVAARTITVQLCAWDEARTVTDPWRAPYAETHARGSLVPAEPMAVYDRHLGELVGRMDPPTDAGPGPVTALHIAHTRAGDDVLALIDAEVIRAVSMEFAADPSGEIWTTDRTAVTRTRSLLTGCAFAFRPELTAPILARAEEAEPMTMTDTPPAEPAPEPEPLPEPEPEPESVTAELIAMRGELARLTTTARPAAPAARFASLGDLVLAGLRDRDRTLPRDRLGGGLPIGHHRAWTDTTIADVPGLMPPQQLAQLFDVIAAQQPLVEAAGSLPPPTRLTVEYPYVSQRPSVAVQATPKTEIASQEIKVLSGSWTVSVFAGGTDIDRRVLDLSDPSYMTVHAALYAEEMARAVDVAAYAAYDGAAAHNASIGATASGWNQELFDLAATIAAASRRWPNRLVISPDLWAKFGGAADSDGRPLFTSSSPMNNVGTASLTSQTGEVRGLTYVVDPHFPADRGALFNSEAFRVALGPVQTLTADVPKLLGLDWAIYRYAAFVGIDPAGMGLFATGTAPTAVSARKAAK